MGRLYYFPRPYPDELIGSLLLRACQHYGITLNGLPKLLGNKGNGYWPLGMPRALDVIATATGIKPDELLWHHTLFPYATAYICEHQTKRMSNAFMGADTKGNAALSQATTIGVEGQRYCPICREEDYAQFGEAYWHRAHNLPFVSICLKHNAPLQVTSRSKAGIRIQLLPGAIQGVPTESKLPVAWAGHLTRLSTELLTRAERHSQYDWYKSYRVKAIKLGVDRHGGGFASRSIAQAFQVAYGHDFLEAARLNFRPDGLSWPAQMLREKQRIPFSTPKHVLMNTFLALAESPNGDCSYPKAGKHPVDYDNLDKQFVQSLTQALEKIRQAKNRVAIKEILSPMGIFHTIKHNRLNLPRTIAVLAEFKASEFSARQTGTRKPRKKRIDTNS